MSGKAYTRVSCDLVMMGVGCGFPSEPRNCRLEMVALLICTLKHGGCRYIHGGGPLAPTVSQLSCLARYFRASEAVMSAIVAGEGGGGGVTIAPASNCNDFESKRALCCIQARSGLHFVQHCHPRLKNCHPRGLVAAVRYSSRWPR